MVDRIKWMENRKSIALYATYTLRWYNTQVSKISIQVFSLYSIGHRWNEADRRKKKYEKPKVLLAFQSSLKQEIKFTNKNEWTKPIDR